MTAEKRLAMAKKELLQIKKLMDKHKFNINTWGNASYYIFYTQYTEYEINATTREFPIDNINNVVYVRKCLRNKNKLTFWDTNKGEFTANSDYDYFNKIEYKYFPTSYSSTWPIATLSMSDETERRYNTSCELKNNKTMVELKSDIYDFIKNIAIEAEKLPYVKTTITEMKSECTGMTMYLTVKFNDSTCIIIRISEHEPICNLHDYSINIVDKTFYDILDEVLEIVMQNK